MTAFVMEPLRTASRAAVTARRYVSTSTPGVTVYDELLALRAFTGRRSKSIDSEGSSSVS